MIRNEYSVLHSVYIYICVCVVWCVCVCCVVCVCVCVCGHVYVVYEDTNLYNDMGWHRYYKEKVIYEDIFSVPII